MLEIFKQKNKVGSKRNGRNGGKRETATKNIKQGKEREQVKQVRNRKPTLCNEKYEEKGKRVGEKD